MATPLFDKMEKYFPGLKHMSARRFSKLTRQELYNIASAAKKARLDEDGYFYRYSSRSTPDLASSAYEWALNLK